VLSLVSLVVSVVSPVSLVSLVLDSVSVVDVVEVVPASSLPSSLPAEGQAVKVASTSGKSKVERVMRLV
jgi:hypothetical protein